MTNLIWLLFIFLIGVLVVSVLWFIWRLRHFSNSHNQTFLDDKLMQSMLGDETLSKELKSALVGKTSGARPVASSGDAAVEEEEGQTPASTQTVKEKKAI
ncbi:MAG: hypothetical protein Q3M24_20190 [Candidatus Electrothrix aestuarii]|uniref:Uncharacterized protein n=1 Tax=Candidatus Electrothrix aestuarii TaxID=3062594 RepID=A0AAU8LUQ6_9BACT|nr:hypothetical protein [Candidatus Electrothrix aestuarii]WPD20937.1 MAG: hypothetical protein SD837_12085 [Candidatus Electrothrix sp. GW3-3]